ncbi:MAG TPA: ATP-binding cassette domain-containing protein [Nitrospiraceae bacterium]|nr:ATP-binding cassette domain-containing protein [Nitrospiraceae bacterium]
MRGKVLVLDAVTVDMKGSGEALEIDLSVDVGEFLVVTGPTRSGKSLLLELCGGLVSPRTGRVTVFGSDWASLAPSAQEAMRLRIGMVLQQPGLLSNMTVYNNVALPLRYHRPAVGEAERHALVMARLEALALDHVYDRFPAQLTPGEVRCAAIARAMMLEPEVLLLDDVVAGLDAGMIARLQVYLESCRRNRPLAILATLRLPSPLLEQTDRVLLLRNGHIESVGPRDVVLRDAQPSTKLYVS